ncbi:MAG TPA: hypothetical protein VEQ60_17380, partial [Longimicrobium sp.]|nr:hypothetical protein [Longimicrobium sp.]
KQICRWTVLLAALLAGCDRDGPAGSGGNGGERRQDEAPYGDVERIAHAYHGLLLDADLKEIPMDLPLIASMQKSLFARLLAEADPGLAEEVRLLREDAEQSGFGAEETALANNAILGTLLDRSDEKLRARYDWRYRVVREQTWRLAVDIHPGLLEWIRKRGLEEFGIPGLGNGARYIADCERESVPTPPAFPGEEWGDSLDLRPEFNFIGRGEVKVFAIQNEDGVCYALPRTEGLLLGIICQSARTGKACFYDNSRPGSEERIDWRRETMTAWDLQSGYDLDEACTDCHRGTNAFIIHPGSALQIPGISTSADVRYTPIGRREFVNPGPLALPALKDEKQGSCDGCHEIPRTTPEYCLILQRAVQTTMPPGGPPAGWIPPDTHPYYAHVEFLARHCSGG